jgi:glycosyltransferase involved in cell wall biosynthesis
MMRIANVSTFATRGGAARAAYRLHREFLRLGADSRFCSARDAVSGDPTAVPLARHKSERLRFQAANYLEKLSLGKHRPTNDNFHANAWRHLERRSLDPLHEADVICLYWVAGMLTPQQIGSFGQPVVWRLSDCWPFTGGCHYPGTCRKFESECGECPVLGSHRKRDLSWREQERKRAVYAQKRITVVAPSHWIAREARRSRLFSQQDVRVIATGVDTNMFRPGPKAHLRQQLGFPPDAFVILTGAQNPSGDPRKGLAAVMAALQKIRDQLPARVMLAVFGTSAPIVGSPISAVSLGALADDLSLSQVYAACDVFVCASSEDNLPNTVLESMACGVPVVAFSVGGIPEAVDDEQNGWLVAAGDVEALGAALLTAQRAPITEIGLAARKKIEAAHNLRLQAAHYLRLFESLCPPTGS